MEVTEYFKNPFDFSIVEVKIRFELTADMVNILFVPNNSCSNEEKDAIKQIKTSQEQKAFFDKLESPKSRLHEGCEEGCLYAVKKYEEITQKKIFGTFIVELTYFNSGATHDVAFYVCAKAVFKLLNFDAPQYLAYHDEQEKRFFFDDYKDFPIGTYTIKEMRKMYGEYTFSLLEKDILLEYEKQRKRYFGE